ncbi:MAG: hypothetical protein IPK44_01980 [Candidatus Accumulibacter sp.]|uniref:hypothetical protein n=1 Tax=Accumulibacter sp. TaxID=2053492 RepID=UPI00258E6269|nr:hypothetical protein [Accumulibacter sp.]MBK8113370.1 hypothetical protein [Accumulibacter sp.]
MMKFLHFLVISAFGIPAFLLGIIWYYISIAFTKGAETAGDFNLNDYSKWEEKQKGKRNG